MAGRVCFYQDSRHGYSGRKIAAGRVVTSWDLVTCPDCVASYRADQVRASTRAHGND